MRTAFAALGLLLAASGPGWAQDATPIAGEATVVDADAIRVGGKSVMLWGIESVERPQTCTIDGVVWACYPAAVRALETLAAGEIRCEQVGEPDGYGRILGTCYAGEVNLNEALVRAGFALAKRNETEDYVTAEEAAKAEKIGLWQGEFVLPADFRRAHAIRVDRP
jgi:endonuclease YncB( thermonuclease family)